MLSKLFTRKFCKININEVKKLRDITGSPLTHCKTALKESEGDITKAKDWLRAKGILSAEKRLGRDAGSGLIGIRVNNAGSLIELNCETDFVAKCDKFQNSLETILDTLDNTGVNIHSKDASSEQVLDHFIDQSLNRPFDEDLDKMNVQEGLTHLISKTGENTKITTVFKREIKENQTVGTYIHSAINQNAGKIGALVFLTADSKSEEI